MKVHIKKLLLILVVVISSCSKESVVQNEETVSEFRFNVLGIKDDYDIDQVASIGGQSKEPKIISQDIQDVSEGYEAIVSLEEVASGFGSKSIARNLNTKDKQAATIKTNVKFRVVFYTMADVLVGAVDGTIGSSSNSSTVILSRNTTYKYVAYSNNDTESPEAFDPATGNVTLSATRELLYEQGTYQVPATGNIINITFAFSRKSAAIELVFDARGMFGDIVKIDDTRFVSPDISLGSLNLLSGQTSSAGNISNPSQGFLKYETYNQTLYNERVKAVSFYFLALNQALPSQIKVRFNYPTITGDRRARDGFADNWGDNHYFNTTAGELDLTVNIPVSLNLKFTPGKKYRIYATVLMKGIEKGGNIWGRGNLYQRRRAPYVNGTQQPNSNPYQFKDDYMLRIHAGSNAYQTYSGSNANLVSGEWFTWTEIAQDDPCAKVFPAGYWKLPTTLDYTNLLASMTTVNVGGQDYSPIPNDGNYRNPYVVEQGGNPSSVVPVIRMAKFLAQSNTGVGSAEDQPYDNVRRITFMYFGRTGTGSSLQLDGLNARGYYWTSNADLTNTNNAYAYKLETTVAAAPNNAGHQNVSMEKSRRANIKCIKNSAFSLQNSHRPIAQ